MYSMQVTSFYNFHKQALQYLHILQWCCWGLISSGMWCLAVGLWFPVFKMSWVEAIFLKFLKFGEQYSITFEKTWIPNGFVTFLLICWWYFPSIHEMCHMIILPCRKGLNFTLNMKFVCCGTYFSCPTNWPTPYSKVLLEKLTFQLV